MQVSLFYEALRFGRFLAVVLPTGRSRHCSFCEDFLYREAARCAWSAQREQSTGYLQVCLSGSTENRPWSLHSTVTSVFALT